MKYYLEHETGDYLAVDFEFSWLTDREYFSARATAIANEPSSICTTGVCKNFLKHDCTEVDKEAIPKDYMKMF